MVAIVWNTAKAPPSGRFLNIQPLNEEVGLKFSDSFSGIIFDVAQKRSGRFKDLDAQTTEASTETSVAPWPYSHLLYLLSACYSLSVES